MKRIGNLYQQMLNKDLIAECIKSAAQGKKDKNEIAPILDNMNEHIDIIYKMLETENVRFTPYHVFEHYDPHSKKTRKICRPAFFPDQIIHWCMITVLRPTLMRGMYQYCSGSIPGRGAAYGCRCVRKWITVHEESTQYIAKLDITKFYESIDLDVLDSMLASKIKDTRMLSLLSKLLHTLRKAYP